MKTSVYTIVACLLFSMTAVAAVDSTGIKLLRDRENEKAQAFFESAVKKNPNDAESQYYLAAALLRLHKVDEAQDAIEEALERNDNVSKYHYLRGAILGEKAMNANVISQGFLAPKIKNAFLRAAELDPKNIDAHIGLFNYYMRAPGIMGGSEEKGFAEAKTIIGLDAHRGHMTLAGFHASKKEWQKAEAEYKLALAADPKSVYGHYQYGRTLFNMERWDQAIEKFQYTLYLEKNHAGSIWMLAAAYEKKGLTAKARETYQWLLQVDPNGRRADDARKKLKELQ